jgi:hypothetical protein
MCQTPWIRRRLPVSHALPLRLSVAPKRSRGHGQNCAVACHFWTEIAPAEEAARQQTRTNPRFDAPQAAFAQQV